MKKLKLFMLLLLLTTVGAAQLSFDYNQDFNKILNKSKKANDELNYNKLLQRFNKNDTSLSNYEVLALMIGYTAQPAYKPYADLSTERQIYNYNDDKNYQTALDTANKFLQSHPLSIKTLFEKSFSLYQLDQRDSSIHYLQLGRRLLRAMEFSGSGKDINTPMFALGPADGQQYIYKHLSAGIGTMGSGRDNKKNFIDILEVKTKKGDSYKMYFVIQHATAKMFED